MCEQVLTQTTLELRSLNLKIKTKNLSTKLFRFLQSN